MTPKELCDLAAKINAAVPGLVPDFKEIGRYLPVLYDQHERRWEDDDAAAMMLGRCWAWVRRRGDDDPPDMALVAIMECYVALRDYVQSTLPGAKAMTPTEISAAYAALHERWPELRPESILELDADSMWSDHEYQVIDDDLAHAACFLACLKACADRDFDVNFRPEWGGPKFYKISGGIVVDIAHPNTITEVMDRVMQLPKVNA